MTEFLGTRPYLRSALWVAMETMHFHIAQTNIFWGTKYFCKGGGVGAPNEHYGTHKKLSWGKGCKVGQISSRVNTIYTVCSLI